MDQNLTSDCFLDDIFEHKNIDGLFLKYAKLIKSVETIRTKGRVESVTQSLIESIGPITKVGDVCTITSGSGENVIAEVIAVEGRKVKMLLLSGNTEVEPGATVYSYGKSLEVMAGEELLGRVLDGVGNPIDDKSLSFFNTRVSVFAPPPHPLKRDMITEPLYTGVKAIDAALTVGKGQRIGIFSGSGVGKSTLLGMIARGTSADVNVICLVGERGREVKEFIERDLGEEGLRRSVVVVSGADESPLAQVRSLYTATTISEYFRDQGKDVMLMVDSVTRMAMAQREIGTAVGEAQVIRGYSPSVFKMLRSILERPGMSDHGSITMFCNVLVEGDDLDEPVVDAVRGVLDGHIVLSRKIAETGHYPAIDITKSISRLMPYICSSEHVESARRLKELLSAYHETLDLIKINAYQRGSDRLVDEAMDKIDHINDFLTQSIFEKSDFEETLRTLLELTSSGKRSVSSKNTQNTFSALG